METPFSMPNFFSTDAFAAWEGLTKASTEHTKQFETLNLTLADKLMKKQAEIFNLAVNTGNQAIALYAEGKSLPEVLADQARLANDSFSKMFSCTREAAELVMSSQEGYREWFEQGLKQFTDHAQAAGATLTSVVPTRKAA